ncbi:DUF4190 domain-containing protein [Cellulomonas triticagri]|uniref:DUF4190 domain-containing protein n=1 Tax=Cellulomonas triticagri TaxID=2483352 RepID=A0A3M2J404_9CELL|nr:DUF4190 domain-containing protein [Cellulomonas triticagri]RMI08817.1 DUF4190 domain-containing protein [Cellulomonas triticagri]
MSNDGTSAPEPGREPDDRTWPAPAPSGYEASSSSGPAPSGYEAPSSTGPATPAADTPTEAFPRPAQDAPTQAFPVPGQPTVAFPTTPAPPTGTSGTGTSAWPTAPGASASTPSTPGDGTTPAGQPTAPATDPYAAFAAPGQNPSSAPGPSGQPTPTGAPYGYPQQGQQPGQPGQQGAGGPGYPPPPGGTPYGAAPYGQYPGPVPAGQRTDGVSIAALVTGILLMGVVPIVLGVIGLGRVKKNGTQGRGLAIAGIVLGGLAILGSIAVGLTVFFAVQSHNDRLDTLHSQCEAGDMGACDDLYQDSVIGSDHEEFGKTCGGRTDGTVSCSAFEDGFTYGDNAELDALWDACAAGDATACDTLYESAPVDSEYEEFGATCGGTTDGSAYCADGGSGLPEDLEDLFGDDTAGTEEGAADTGASSGGYGSDPALDALYDACAAGDGTACDDLYWASPEGSSYEDFGLTCGGRVTDSFSCELELAA